MQSAFWKSAAARTLKVAVGKLHTYTWQTDATKFSDYMGFVEKEP